MPADHFLRPLLSRSAAGAARIRKAGAPVAFATAVELAVDSTTRKRGLLDRAELPAGAALVIAPCSGVHTFGMRFRIDVIFAARNGKVLKVVHDLGPRRFAVSLGAFAAIEMTAGEAARAGVTAGDLLQCE